MKRLKRRGHCTNTTVPILVKALQKRSQVHTRQHPNTQHEDTISAPLFFHLPFNPLDISANRIYTAFERHIIKPINDTPFIHTTLDHASTSTPDFDTLRVVYHKHLNLGNILSPRKLRLGQFSIQAYLENKHTAPNGTRPDSLL